MQTVAKGLVPFCAVILGVLIYVRSVTPWIAVGIMLIGVVTLIVARALISTKTRFSAVLITMWILVGISLIAFITWGSLWVALHIPIWFPNLPSETTKEVCSVITGALATLMGVLFTKDFEEGGGFFWPGTQFRSGVNKVFSSGRLKLHDKAEQSVPYDLAFNDRTHQSVKGWGFAARWERAKHLQAWVDSLKPPPPPPPPDNPSANTSTAPSTAATALPPTEG